MTSETIKKQLDEIANHKDTALAFSGKNWAYLLFGIGCLNCRTQVEILRLLEENSVSTAIKAD